MMLPNLFNIFGRNGGLTISELESMSHRNKFSDYLPWAAYDERATLYYNTDETVGFLFECVPLAFAGARTQTTLDALFRIDFPERSIVQFILYADDNIDPYLDAIRRSRGRESPIVRNATEAMCDFLLKGVKGMASLSGIPIRNFRLFVAVKMPKEELTPRRLEEIHITIRETLHGASLSPEEVPPEALLDWMRRLFNGKGSVNNTRYADGIPIRKQIILSETEIKKQTAHLQIGDRIFRCATPKIFPKEVDLFQTGQLFGGCWGMDGDQMKTPFLYTLNILFHNLKAALHKKCNMILFQKGFGSFARTLARKQDEFQWATDELEKGTRFLRVIPILWVWDQDQKSASEAIIRAKRLWEGQGYIMQEDRGILPILFISALPFGLYDQGGAIDLLDRDFIAPLDAISSILPVQSDFAGGGAPVMSFAGRKGQAARIDIFDQRASNHNVFIAGGSGKGKSFFVNSKGFGCFASNAMLRIIDIGGSYKKLARMFKGRYLDFREDSKICLNPFTHIREIKEDLSVIASIVLQMIFSTTGAAPAESAETAMTLIKSAVKWAYESEGNDAQIDTVRHYLRSFPKYMDEEFTGNENFTDLAQILAFNLTEFTSGNSYGRWFNGKSTFDISQDEWVVLELEYLKPQKELFKVVTLQVINEVTRDLYLSDRMRPRMAIFDEAWQFLESGADSVALKEVIKEGYRRARKYRASFTIITQSLLDSKMFGAVGDVIRANSAFKFYLESTDFEKAREEKLIDYDPFTMKLLKSVKSNRPKYSEIFMDTPFGVGVVRLVVDPFSYYVYTSDGKEVAEIESMVSRGMPYEEAIGEMVRKYRS
ncbi:TraC family protein [Candidatus Manganitrophus noduliformans]|nr:TraC family protein [Candidatus Manganitrophus noduliformans]